MPNHFAHHTLLKHKALGHTPKNKYYANLNVLQETDLQEIISDNQMPNVARGLDGPDA